MSHPVFQKTCLDYVWSEVMLDHFAEPLPEATASLMLKPNLRFCLDVNVAETEC